MIIGAKRKEEVIKTKRWGFFNDGIHEQNPRAISVVKRYAGRWEIWEVSSWTHGKSVAAFRTKWQTIDEAYKYAERKGLPVIVNC